MREDSLANKVYTEVRKKILSSQLAGGARLVESAWAEKLAVSRVAVREAFMRLAGESLVEFGEKGGCFVKDMTADDVKEIRELRELLEVGALKLLFKKKSKQLVKELELICNDFTDMVNKGYYGGACEADVKFHEKIMEGTDNSRLINIYKNSNIPLFHMKLGAIMGQMEDYKDTDTEHRALVEALKADDWEKAYNTLVHHLDRGEQAALEWM
ncbi:MULTISPECIES: GntR family transcriptional regulator [Sphingobacterium]|uniref:GntR family transcriptional regulator n=1 Tax=Sphingobacterium phlebotomi TaxID=2605433 RepID=A0A5D4H5D8_9SPHI|nr:MULTISPECIES: GntR family transcriptional regulator [Sphingobacterium]NGM66365.1 GntR family transcriptional regulator [Sphingobacterium sp. SGR-19]TYR36036.1 GntR family transcriptional regulator [Sphingobacterium phlebotomi]